MAVGIDPLTGQPYEDAPDTNRDGPNVPALPAPPEDTRKRWNLTPNWQDPFNPPSPGDPYWDEWIAANPDYRGQGYNGPVTPKTTPPPTGGGPPGAAPPPAAGGPPAPSPFPTFTAPGFTPSVPLQAPANPYRFTPFDPHTFTAPTLEEARNQPGYLFGLKQGQDALQNSAAARGTLRGGGTLKDLFDYTNAAAEQNYGNVFNQNKNVFDTNEGQRFGAWASNNLGALNEFNTNYGVSKDVNTSLNAGNQQDYTNAFQNAGAEFNPKFNAATLTFQDAYNRWLGKLNALTHIYDSGAS